MSAGVQIAAVCGISAALAGAAAYVIVRRRNTPEKRERKRRLTVNQFGRLADAVITEVSESALFYTYSVRGVQYETSQDISALREHLAVEPERLIGAVASLKYAPKNPANSILICEEWSGLRQHSPPRDSLHLNGVRHQA